MIIGGSVRQAGERLRVTAQLIDGATGCYIWSESVDATLSDLFPAQERVAEAIAKRIEPELGDRRSSAASRRPNENLAAHNLYLQGRYHLNQRTEEGLRKALDFFEKSLIEDAEHAAAHAGLADAYGLLAHYGVFGPAEVWTKAAASAAAAVMLDANSAEAHTSLAHVKSTQDWDWAGAEREFQRAISLDPRCATSHHWYAMSCLAPLGRLDEALDEMGVAQSLDPVSSIVARDLAVIHFYRRDFETALEQCDHTIELNPHFAPAYWILGVIQEQRKDFDESAAAFQRAVYLSPQTPRMHGALGRTFALAGRKKQALEVLKKLETYAKERYVSPLEFAWIQFALGDIDLGFRWMQKALEDRSFDLISIKVDPRFDPLKGDPRFEAIARRHGRRLLGYLSGRGDDVRVGQAQAPFQRLEVHAVDVRIVPGRGARGRATSRTRGPLPYIFAHASGKSPSLRWSSAFGGSFDMSSRSSTRILSREYCLRLIELVGEVEDRRPVFRRRERLDPR